jgi:monoamine oxidase
MPHAPLFQRVRDHFAAVTPGQQQPLDRRSFLGRAAALAAVLPGLGRAFPARGLPRIAVVGGGLAGLTCAHRLQQAGLGCTVYEAEPRLGGRCWTRRGDFAEGQLAEHGGELIDQGHAHIRHLAQELGLPLDNLLRAEVNGSEPSYFIDGAPYAYRDASVDMRGLWHTLHRDLSAASYPTRFDSFTARGQELDRMPLGTWLEQSVPGGRRARLARLLEIAYVIEYGAEVDAQSALNLIYLLGYTGPGQLRVFGTSNEKYHVRGGNDRIVERLVAGLAGQIETGHALVAVRAEAGGGFTLTFDVGGRGRELRADRVVLALPFSVLARSVDLGQSRWSARKRTAIQELGMGQNSKLNVQFTTRLWRGQGCNGDTYSETGYQATWEVSRGQAGSAGILVDYSGGAYAQSFGQGTLAQLTQRFLGQLEPVLPGSTASWNGNATVDFWPGNPRTLGSYSFYRPGQYTRFGGIEGAAEGGAHFCGEHTSQDAQGYLEGAVESGERVAAEIVSAVPR